VSVVAIGVAAPAAGPDPARARDAINLLAAAGVDHLVVGDHVTFFGGFGVDGLIHATALLMLHPDLPVHTSVYLLPLRHPVLVARQLSTLSSFAPGRLVLGVGIGGEDPHEVESCGVDPRTRGRRMDEAMVVLSALQAGEPVTTEGEFFSLGEVRVDPAPSPRVPIVVGGRSSAAVRRAGRLGDGWLGIWVSPGRFSAATREAEDEAARMGRSEVEWRHGMTVWCGFGDGTDAATAGVAPVMEGIYGIPFDRFDRYVPRGTPAQVADGLATYVDAGCRSFNLLVPEADAHRLADDISALRGHLSGSS
jgi:alkanesulfonate monooxygenase SsuD/methylene tetrahydromethanopterin reductase-like flavin-dependent oxidoreductase (luciferase family)